MTGGYTDKHVNDRAIDITPFLLTKDIGWLMAASLTLLKGVSRTSPFTETPTDNSGKRITYNYFVPLCLNYVFKVKVLI